MSDGSSSLPPAPRASGTLPGWLVACMALLSTAFLFFFAQLVGGVAISIYPALVHLSHDEATLWLGNSTAAQFTYGLIADGVMVAGVWLMLKWFHWDWRSIGFRRPKVAHVIIGAVSVIPYIVLYLGIVVVVQMLVPSLNVDQKQDIGFNNVQGPVSLALTFLSLVVLPPLAEETVMRGFLYTGLKKLLPWTIAALVVSVLFGAAHLAEGGDAGPLWIGAIDTFSLSLVLVILREKTGNLWAGITLHAVKNGIAFVTLFILGNR